MGILLKKQEPDRPAPDDSDLADENPKDDSDKTLDEIIEAYSRD